MKNAFLLPVLIGLAVVVTACREAPDSETDPLLLKVEVKKVDLNLDDPQEEPGSPLWKHFGNAEYQKQFNTLSAENWTENWDRFQNRLIDRAKAGGFDHGSLNRILDGIRPKPEARTAKVPVGAFLGHKGADEVWIIVVKWEYDKAYEVDGEKQWHTLGHIEVYAFRVKDGEKVAYATCR